MAKVLIIDDDRLLVTMYEQKFRKDGLEVITALNGGDGLKKIKEEKPALVLLDIMMPKMNGLEVLGEVKKDPEIKNIPVILLTNLARDSGEEDIEKGLELGAVTYLVKSQLRPSQVVVKVKEILAATKRDELPEVKSA
ncbi:response regulator [candidate division WWE3 bacterium CG10_big_fil_rev_8_21_14_0_10_48_23]|uniref:Response regulator n=1 Tax=candidate division WWE3 bacterium CG_4_9_14_0_2_um_filter_48_10 TaxID=1975078 RepID=A0A2M8EIY3_UNCKA|nr:MAG: response regulator [candidate division WWE3 bacterium CG_4_9_14_0_2_um_filter_48_10]PJE51644.1 MAG: response regulator [candidate division WWE3 bacterium CG10_big_fil_rev_8_21_14_0_10_48_23]